MTDIANQRTTFAPQQAEQSSDDTSGIREHMEVIGADGVHLGTVDQIEDHRIKLTKADSGMGGHEGHHHYISRGLVAGIEGRQGPPQRHRGQRLCDGRRGIGRAAYPAVCGQAA